MNDPETELVSRLLSVDSVVEVGVGNRPGVAGRLAAEGVAVTATDIDPRPVPDGVRFVVDDVTDPDRSVYAGADVVFARNLPPELHRPTRAVARSVDAACWFTTLGGDPPTVPVDTEQLPGGETLYRATGRDGKVLE
ncbi:UPF0146 family protein [Halomicroarcula sp. GCM10025324]|uniref:UPF0146 family protein n=1 Tax=Haloarcula TaxID=2237 RepID=UPI0023E8779C|nr:UPF0146 family protein [Halomicroarcula sp. ZS-22-S1]